MERSKSDSIVTNSQIVLYTSYGILAAFIGFSVYFSIGRSNQIAEYVAIFFSLIFIVFGSRSKSLGLVAFAWIIVGISFVIPFVYTSYASYPTVIVSVMLLLVSYELTRFDFEMRAMVQSVRVLHSESIEQLEKVTRNHTWVLVQVVVATLLLSLVVGYLLPGLITVNPPELGVAIFASVSLILIACVLLLVKD